jgi:16S rRNA (guanine(966)-N(2))-methyltransferase RsmD
MNAQRPAAAPAQPGAVRIVGGRWRRSVLPVPAVPGLRPTPDRVRETLFNWLGQDLSGWRCVDAFAGSGALGLEAASRGAAPVWLFERDPRLVRNLQQQVQRLQADAVQVRQADALSALASLAPQSQDLVLLDPPFDGPLFEPALAQAARLVPPGGWVYLEAPRPWPDDALAALGLSCWRHLHAGAVHAHLLQRLPSPTS